MPHDAAAFRRGQRLGLLDIGITTNGTPSRKAALKRSWRILKRAVRTFRASPSIAARAAVEHALDAVQRAHQLAEHPPVRTNADIRHWEDAWLAAYLGLYRIAKQRGAA